MPTYGLILKEGTAPEGEPLPATLEGFLAKIREFTEVSRDSNDPEGDTVRSILVQPGEPTGAEANDLWVKTHASSSRPIGLYAYQGSAWKPINQTNSGTTAGRPVDGTDGESYFDTEIGVMLMWKGSGWVTQAGSPGDLKFVYLDKDLFPGTAGEAEALRLNPGWSVLEGAKGKSLVAVDTGDSELFGAEQKYKSAGNSFGEKTHVLTEAELASHIHGGLASIDPDGGDGGDGQDAGLDYVISNGGGAVSGTAGEDEGHENRPPSYTAYLLIKDGYATS